MEQGTAMADKKHAARFPGGGGLQTHGSGSRQLDWVYANVAGVTVERRVHPLLSVPWRGRSWTCTVARSRAPLLTRPGRPQIRAQLAV